MEGFSVHYKTPPLSFHLSLPLYDTYGTLCQVLVTALAR
jgi:hypothetical protein